MTAREDAGLRWLAGCLDARQRLRRRAAGPYVYDVRTVENRPVLVTSPLPRDIPGVPRERNPRAASFAVANASGFVARALETAPGADAATVFAMLQEDLCAPLA